ncbi:MAG: gamma-glutamylcyclotransferase [Oleiphilus sp.]|nr:MAG: gamma-glutamylcyclotransferase [Oleiphilus sp.]
MVADTQSLNQAMTEFEQQDSVWLFGYGSLIYKADFPYIERRPARIEGWVRRFWQGSHDHRGTPESPGRVVTLFQRPEAVCEGIAYLITPKAFAHLDHREKNGYLRYRVPMIFQNNTRAEGLMYVANEDNAAYLGEATEEKIARQIAQCRGPSGSNREYVLRLAEALRSLNEVDEHVFAIERFLRSE